VENGVPSPRQEWAVRVIIYYDVDPKNEEKKFVSLPPPAIAS
jgi:hypothetical protein